MCRRVLLVFLLSAGLVAPAAAQTTGAVAVRDASTPTTVVNVGNSADNTLRVHIIANDVSSSGGTSSNFGSAVPSAGTAAGFSDGTNMQLARVVDLDTGAGTVFGMITNLVRRASGGPVELIGQGAMAASLPVVIASDQSTMPVSVSGTVTTKLARASSATLTNVASSATNVTILASNAARNGATVFNDSTQTIFVKFGATASTTSFTVKIDGGGYFVIDPSYTGQLDALWASANGSARVTEW